MLKTPYHTLKATEKIPKFNKSRALNKNVRPGKNPKLKSVGPTFIPDHS